MPRKKKSRYFVLVDERTSIDTVPFEWDKLPDEVIEKCSSGVIHDLKVYSKKDQIGSTSVIYFDEIDLEEVEKLKQDVGDAATIVEDEKNKIIFIV